MSENREIYLPGADFSDEATNRAVFRETFRNPFTLFSTGIGVLGSLGLVLFGPAAIPGVAAVGGFFGGAGSAAYSFWFRRDKLAGDYIKSLYEALEKHRGEVRERVRRDLTEFTEEKGFSQYVTQGVQQFDRAEEKFRKLETLLGKKLNTTEITYLRYRGTAEQVYLSVLDNLDAITSVLNSASAIDVDYIHSRMTELRQKVDLEDADRKEVETLEARLSLRETQLAQVNEMLTENELAMTNIDQATAAISAMRTGTSHAKTSIGTAMRDLEELAKRASCYTTRE